MQTAIRRIIETELHIGLLKDAPERLEKRLTSYIYFKSLMCEGDLRERVAVRNFATNIVQTRNPGIYMISDTGDGPGAA